VIFPCTLFTCIKKIITEIYRNTAESDVKHPYTISTDCLCCYGYSIWKTMDLMPDLVKPKNMQFVFPASLLSTQH